MIAYLNKLQIKARLNLIILAVLIPLITAQTYSICCHYNQVIEFELEANYDFAGAVGLILVNHLESIGEELYAISKEIAAYTDMDAEELSAYLKLRSDHDSSVIRYLYLDSHGTVIASSNKEVIGCSALGRDYYDRIMAGEDFVVSDALISRGTNEPVVIVLRANRGGNELTGIFGAVIDLDKLTAIMPCRRIRQSASFGIADSNGIMIYKEGYPRVINEMIGLNPQGPASRALTSSKPVQDKNFLSTITNNRLLGVAIPLPEIGWVAFANNEYAEVSRSAFISVALNLLILLIASTISILLAANVSKGIIKSVNDLKEFAGHIAEGNMEARANISGSDELAATGEALNQMAIRVEQLEENRRLFIQTSAHELRNPLTGIKGIVALIKMRLTGGKPVSDVLYMLDAAEKEVDRLTKILNQILGAFKEQSHTAGLPYNMEILNLNGLLTRVTQAYDLGSENINITLEFRDSEEVFIKADAARLEDVLRNLLSNADKYSLAEKEIKVALQVTDGSAVVSVEDKGVGIPEDQLEQIFESFVRGDNYEGHDPGGIGLGLYICKDIITRHGGDIWAVNNQGSGSTFYLKLPLVNVEEDRT